MKKGGGKGNSTMTGIIYEKKVDILNSLDKNQGYNIKNKSDIYYNGEIVATAYPKHKLYGVFLEDNGVEYKKRIGRKILPDQAIYIHSTKKMIIIEVKSQKVEGSVDEKITTCDFKKKQYEKLFKGLVTNVELIYCLSPHFDKKKYKDALSYIHESGCQYFFEKIPLSAVGLPEKPEKKIFY